MAVTTIFILFPLALVSSTIFVYLFFSRHKILCGLKIITLQKIIRGIIYIITVLVLSVLQSILGMMLLIGIIGIPVLLVIDIVSIILLVKRIACKTKNIKRKWIK